MKWLRPYSAPCSLVSSSFRRRKRTTIAERNVRYNHTVTKTSTNFDTTNMFRHPCLLSASMEGTGKVSPMLGIAQFLVVHICQYQKETRRSCRNKYGGNHLWNVSRAAFPAQYPAQVCLGVKTASLVMFTTRLFEAQVAPLITAPLSCPLSALGGMAGGSLLGEA